MWGVLHFDFGVPYQSPGETVMGLIAHAWLPSLMLGGSASSSARRSASCSAWLRRYGAIRWIDYLASAHRDARPDHAGLRHLDAA